MKQETNPRITFENFTLDIPVYNASSRSIKSHLARIATGGILAQDKPFVTVRALDKVSFSLESGDKIALFGHNGAGKSTLLRALAGVYTPTEGSANIQGKVSSLIDVSLGINVESTGRENVFIRSALMGVPKKTIQEMMSSIIEFSELGDFIDLPVRTYSSGMQMRLAFAISTLIRPEILLMDEWLSVGDENFRSKAENRMNEVMSSTKILVLATHSRALAENMCQKAIWLEHGAVRAIGPVKQVSELYFG